MRSDLTTFLDKLIEDEQQFFDFSKTRFFKKPGSDNIDKFGDSIKSSLYMLRLDIDHCLRSAGKRYAIWAGTSLILTGIDLLSQYYTGITPDTKKDEHVEDKDLIDRFSKFCFENNISDLKIPNVDVNKQFSPLNYLRNSVIHGYSIRTHTSTTKTAYYFDVIYEKKQDDYVIKEIPIDSGNDYKYRVNLFRLFKAFNESIKNYENVLTNENVERKNNFIKVQKYYGFIIPPLDTNYVLDDSNGKLKFYTGGEENYKYDSSASTMYIPS